MGATLANTAYSVNIKERLDFSCALFNNEGSLVANAPHVPVHLGSMSEAIKTVVRLNKDNIYPDDVFVLNAPFNGGTHLPDVTVITPVFDKNGKEIIFNSWKDGDEADWVKIGTDVVVLATGKPKTKEEVDVHLSKGCKKVIVASTPENFKDIQIFVPGANDENIDFKSNVFSLGSNTANAVAPILKALNKEVGVERAFFNNCAWIFELKQIS